MHLSTKQKQTCKLLGVLLLILSCFLCLKDKNKNAQNLLKIVNTEHCMILPWHVITPCYGLPPDI